MVVKEREVIRCSCCGQEILAERVGNTIVVRDRRHGVVHSVTIDLTQFIKDYPKCCKTERSPP